MGVKRNRRHLIILAVIIVLSMIVGCASVEKQDVSGKAANSVSVEVNEEKEKSVDWEKWAANTETEGVSLAVFNEMTGSRTFLEDGINVAKYDVQEGDRFSIADREIIKTVYINTQEVIPVQTAFGSYYEIIPKGEYTHVTVFVKGEGEDENSLTYKLYDRK